MEHNSKNKQNFKKCLKIVRSWVNNLFLEELDKNIGTIVLSEKVTPEKNMVNSIKF